MNSSLIEIFTGLAALGALLASLVAAISLYRSINWSRKKAAIDKLEAYDYYDSYGFLEDTVKLHTRDTPIPTETIRNEIEKDGKFLNHMFRVLQYHTSLVRGVETATYKKSIVDQSRSNAITRTYYLFHKYIDQRRVDLNLPSYYDQIEKFALESALDGRVGPDEIKEWARDRIASDDASDVAKQVAAERKMRWLSLRLKNLWRWLRNILD